jgi:hypothetical protein
MIQTAAWPSPEVDEAWKDPTAKGIATMNSRPLTVQLAAVAMTPEQPAPRGTGGLLNRLVCGLPLALSRVCAG